MHGLGYYFPCTHRPTIIAPLQYNIHKASPETMPISFKNSRFPCFDLDESCLTATTVPSGN